MIDYLNSYSFLAFQHGTMEMASIGTMLTIVPMTGGKQWENRRGGKYRRKAKGNWMREATGKRTTGITGEGIPVIVQVYGCKPV